MSETDLVRLAAFLLVGVISGWLAGIVTRGSGLGLWGNIGVGLAGAVVGTYLLGRLGLVIGGGMFGTVLTAFICAFAALALLGQMRR